MENEKQKGIDGFGLKAKFSFLSLKMASQIFEANILWLPEAYLSLLPLWLKIILIRKEVMTVFELKKSFYVKSWISCIYTFSV